MICLYCHKQIPKTSSSERFCSRTCARTYQAQKQHIDKMNRPAKCKNGDVLDVSNGFIEQYRAKHPVCEMCGRPCPTGRALAIDHDHKTKKFRGLLCYVCNRHLGWYDENKDKIRKYLGRSYNGLL